jgi:Fe-S-cluster containining protein
VGAVKRMGKSMHQNAGSQRTGLRFECTGCGACCRRRGAYAFVYLNDREVDALAAYLRISRRSFLRRHTFIDELDWRQLRFADDTCPFLDTASGRCTVYAARPAQCRTFPFWRNFIEADGWTDEVRDLCEGIGQGQVREREEIEAAFADMDAWEDE